jgi:hypothetical protein
MFVFVYLFVVYLATLFVAQATRTVPSDRIVNEKWKENDMEESDRGLN